MSKETTASGLHVTELILALHIEVQSAVDYISTVSAAEATELGKSPVVMGVEQVRVKLPVQFSPEQHAGAVVARGGPETLAQAVANLAKRKGFLVDSGQPGKRGIFTKIRANVETTVSSGSSTPETPASMLGELEITFSPMKRD